MRLLRVVGLQAVVIFLRLLAVAIILLTDIAVIGILELILPMIMVLLFMQVLGYVEQAGWYGGYGRYVRLAHDFGYETAYGHMSSIAVKFW